MWGAVLVKLELKWCLVQAGVQVSARCFFHLILWCGKLKWWNGLWVKVKNGEDSFSAYFGSFLPCSLCFEDFSKEFQDFVCACVLIQSIFQVWLASKYIPLHIKGSQNLWMHLGLPILISGFAPKLHELSWVQRHPELFYCKYWNLGWIWGALRSSCIVSITQSFYCGFNWLLLVSKFRAVKIIITVNW